MECCIKSKKFSRNLFLTLFFIALSHIRFTFGVQTVQFAIEPSDEVVLTGRSAIFHCQLREFSDQVDVQIRWRGDDPFSFFDHRDSHRSILSNGSLHINRVTAKDEGIYQCVATIDPLGAMASRVARLHVVGQVEFADKQPQDLRVFPGQTAHFTCRTVGRLQMHISWLKDDKPLHPEKSRITIMPSGALEIDQVQEDDQGSYRCNASHGGLYKLSTKAILTVDTDLLRASHNIAPIFITQPRSVVVREGSTLTLDCAANGNPRPWLVWLKNGVAVNLTDTRYSKLGTGSLRIEKIVEKDAATYLCRAGNQEDSVDSSAIVDVQVPPRFIREPQDTISTEKKDLELNCQAYGKPEPKVQWYKNGELITVNDYIQSNGHNLKILGLMEMDAGLFQCVASNVVGNAQTTARLTILRSGTDGEGSSMPMSLTPGPPRNVMTAIVSNRFVTLSWTRPEETNGLILGYSVYYRLEGSQRERIVNTSDPTLEEITVQGLQPDRLYHFRVVAHNAMGAGDSSEDLEVSTGAEAHVPSAPVELTVTATSPTSLTIEWKPPAITIGDILKYRLFYMEEDSPEESHVYTTKTAYELIDLKKYTKYCVWVIAVNSNGQGSPSEEVTVRTLSDVPSEPPMNVTVEAASSTSIIVRWEPPPKEGQNGVITGYKLRYRKQKGRGFVVTAAGDRRLYAISELDKGSTYQVRIAAMNVNGTGPSSEWQNIDTYRNDLDEKEVPGMPSNIIARASSNSIRVSWGAPKESNIMVRGYTIGWGKGIPDDYTKVLEGKQRSFNIEDLDENAEYVIAVRAFNEIGDGQPSYVSIRTREENNVAMQSALIPPVGLKAIVLSSTTVVLYWTDPPLSKSLGGMEDRLYTVKYTSPHHSAKPKHLNVTELNCMITDLRPNTLYEFSVKYVKGRRESEWSMVVQNTTQEAPPSSPPRDLTVVPVDDQPEQVNLNWQPPKQSNGLITGYMILYTTDETLRESDWVFKDISGDRMTAIIKDLQPSTTYHIKIQAKNSKGYGPVSSKVTYSTPQGPSSYDSNLFGKDGKPVSSMMAIIVGCSLVSILCVSVIIGVVCCKRAKSRRRNDTYIKGNLKMKTSMKPPDLWIHHDQMELKNLEKSHHSSSDIGASSSGSQMNTLVRANCSHSSEFDPSGSIDKRTYLPSYVGTNISNVEKTSTLKRNNKSIAISLALESPPVSQPVTSSMPSPNCDAARPVYPRTQYRSHLTMESAASPENTYSMQGGYDSISSVQHAQTMPASYQVLSNNAASGGPTCAPGSTDTSTLTKRQLNHPLKSFSVPAPPPQSAPSTPQQKHVVRPQQGSSPYKKPAHSVLCTGSPSNSKLRSGPGTAEETTRLQPSYSTEELNQEMANLEGLMKDLNAITASEFEC